MISPILTIAIPTYSRLEYLKEAVESALQQDWASLEILVGDDGPSDEIPRWVAEKQALEPRLRYYKNPKNLGLAGNWNKIARGAVGNFISIIGDDDRLAPTFASRLMSRAAPGVDVVFCNQYLIDHAGTRLIDASSRHNVRYGRTSLSAGPLDRVEWQVWKNSIPMSAAIVRRSRVLEFPFSEELNTPEIELFLKIARAGGGFSYEPELLADYRVHAASATSSGLRLELLAARLVSLEVAPDVEPAKRDFLGPVLLTSVSRCLEQGRVREARQWLENPYYPPAARSSAKGRAQRLCAKFPSFWARSLFKALTALKHR
jgi:glycosyltransferase involved in cell wall biosynthesis